MPHARRPPYGKTTEPGFEAPTRAGGWAPLGTAAVVLACTYIALVYFRPVVALLYPGSILEHANTAALGGALLAAAGAGYLRHGLTRSAAAFAFVALAILAASSIASRGESRDIVRFGYAAAGTWASYVVFAGIARDARRARTVAVCLAVAAFANSSVALWGSATGSSLFGVTASAVGVGAFGFDAETGRAGGIAGENYVGMYGLPGLLAGMWLVVRSGRWILGSAVVLVAGGGIVVSLSRASALTALVGLGMYLYFERARVDRRAWLGLAAAIIVAPMLYASVLRGQLERTAGDAVAIAKMRWTAEGFTQESRLVEWRNYLDLALDDLVLGKGPGYLAERAAAGALVPHNSWIDVLVEFGVFGLAVYVAAFSTPMLAIRKARDSRARDDLCWYVALFWGMAISLVTLSNPTARILWIVAGCVAGSYARSRSSHQ